METIITQSQGTIKSEISSVQQFDSEFQSNGSSFPVIVHSKENNDTVDRTKQRHERLEGDKQRSGSFSGSFSGPRCVTYVREKKSKCAFDEMPQYPRRKHRRIIAIESSV